MAFPTTSVLDSFTRANENPLTTGGNWSAPLLTTTGTFKLVSNAIQDDSLADGGGYGSAYWNAANFGPGSEVYVTLTTPWQNNASDLWLWLDGNAENSASADGYRFTITYNTGVWYWNVYRFDNNVATELTPSFEAGPTLATGDSVGAEHNGSALTLYYRASGGSWAPASGVSARSDSTYTSGHIGLAKGYQDTTTVLDDFGGGTMGTATLSHHLLLLGVGA